MEDQERPPYLGDSNRWYSSDVAPGGTQASDEDEHYTVAGSDLRIMWDEGAGPLWACDGLLPDDPTWVRRALGLSNSLVADLFAWLSDMSALHQRLSFADARERVQQFDEQGQELAERLQTEVGARYRVWYQA
jgi:hypothetical protein